MIQEHIKTIILMSVLFILIFGFYAISIFMEFQKSDKTVNTFRQAEIAKKQKEIMVVQK